MAQRLRQVHHAEAQIIDAGQGGDIAGRLKRANRLDHDRNAHVLVGLGQCAPAYPEYLP